MQPRWKNGPTVCEAVGINGMSALEGRRRVQSLVDEKRRLEAAGIAITTVDVSELQKAEGAVTCCSIVFGER